MPTSSPSATDVRVRTIAESDVADWLRALNTGFLRAPTPTPAAVAHRAATVDCSRTRGAWDGDRCVATFRSFAQQLTVPGGAPVPADAISNVTVSPTHRRRGLLTQMMAADLAAARDRGDVAATLIAAEFPIYGRYGFGPAAGIAAWEVDVRRAGLDPRWSRPECGGRIDLADGAEIRRTGPELHERFRARQHGAIDRPQRWWEQHTGLGAWIPDDWKEPFHAVYRSPSSEVEGLLTYRADDVWTDGKQPVCTATVEDLIAVTPAAERALWHHVCSIDWITQVRTGHRAVDDLLPLFLPDRRAARRVQEADWLWVRILDVARALRARTYAAHGTLVLEVADGTWPDAERGAVRGPAAGRYRLEAGPDGAACTPTTASPSLTLDAGALAALWLGEESPARLAAAGLITVHDAAAVGTAEVLFRTARRPWCPDVF
jgi:predicted acetyltransferase